MWASSLGKESHQSLDFSIHSSLGVENAAMMTRMLRRFVGRSRTTYGAL